MRRARILILLAVISFGVYKGGVFGALYAFIGLGLTLLVLYMVFDCLHAVASFLHRPNVTNYTTNNTLRLEGPARRGQPDAEEWAGIIETGRQTGRISK